MRIFWPLACIALALSGGLAVAQVGPSAAEAAAYSGLHAAAWHGDPATVAGARREALDARDGHGRTPLHVTIFARRHEVIRALARAGAELGALDDDRYDAVTIAAVADDEATLASERGYTAIIELLASAEARPKR